MSRYPYISVSSKPSSQEGFTLLEIIISLVLTSLLLLGIVQLYIGSVKNASATSKIASLQETGRMALQIINTDVRRINYFGGNIFHEFITGSTGVSDNATTCVADSTDWATMVEQPVFGVNNTNVGYDCITNAQYDSGDILTLRSVSSTPVTDAAINANVLYLRSTLVEGKIFQGSLKADTSNIINNISARNNALVSHSYYVGPSGRSCLGVAIPSLWRKSISSTTGFPESQELLPGVERLQVRYQVGGQYVDAGDATLNALDEWSDVLAIEISVLVKAECPETGFTNDRTFSMGDAADFSPTDGHRRQLFTTVATVRN